MTTSRSSGGGAQGDPEVADATSIVELATGYWASKMMLAAVELGVFADLAGGAESAAELAARRGAAPRAMELLLNAAVAHGLLVKDEDRYHTSALADAFLVPGRPAFLGDALKYSADLFPVWGRLNEAVLSGRPQIPPESLLGGSPEKTRNFVLGMHNRALGVASSLASQLDLSGRRHLLDVGGGPGTYAALLVRQTPGLRATVLDLPAVVEIAAEILAGMGVSDRVEVQAGDYRHTELRPGSDVVLMSGMLHRETPESCRRLLRQAFACLAPGGLLVVADVFFDDRRKVSPPFVTLFALTMMLTSEDGSAHAKTEMVEWMEQAGFRAPEVKPLPPPMPHSVVLARKP